MYELENKVEEIAAEAEQQIKDAANQQFQPRNRAERRALQKKLGKKGRNMFSAVTETAEKLNYIDLIQKLREINEEREKENNENTCEEN